MVLQAEAKELELTKENGKPYKHFKCKLIQPDETLGDTMDFSKETIEKSMKVGWETAKRILK
jgi:hypothetical protein